MTRFHLMTGVSAGALAALCLMTPPALAQQSLPEIHIGNAKPRMATHQPKPHGIGRPTHVAASAPAQSSAPAPAVVPVVAPPPVSIWNPNLPNGGPAFVEKWQLPNTVASMTRQQIAEKVNIIDTEDAVKYMPSLFVRKRNNGDTQAVLATRTWGLNSSARSLVYADDLLLTALIGNDNSIGAPRWGLVSPEEIERVDFLYGPYAAQYPGNSVGGVLKITTRMPEKLEVTAKETSAFQDFSLYGTSKLFWTNETAVTAGDKINDFSWFVTGNWLHGFTQPLTYIKPAQERFRHGLPARFHRRSSTAIPAPIGRRRNSARPRTPSARPAISPTIRSRASSSSPMTSTRPRAPPIRSASGRTTEPRRRKTIW